MKFRPMVGIALFCAWIGLSTGCSSVAVHLWTGEEQGDAAFIAEVDELVRDLVREDNVPGLAIAVVQEGSVLVLRGYGHADRERETPATPETIFRAYSIAKVFTALETVRLAEDGLISLDDRIAGLLPDWWGIRRWDDSSPVTVRHLLTHRSGLPRNSNYHESLAIAQADCLRLQVNSLSDAWAAYPAEYRYKYSNVGLNVLGRLIETDRGEPFAFYMHNHAFPAYGMDHSSFLLSLLPEGSVVATGYGYDRGRYYPQEPYDIIGLASGNLYTSAADLAAFMMRILGTVPGSAPQPIGYDALVSMYTPQFSRAGDPERNGLGWMTSEELMGELMVWHQGGDFDANSIVALMPESNAGICILTNTGSYEGSDLVMLAADIFRGVQNQHNATYSGLLPGLPAAPVIAPGAASSVAVDPAKAVGRYIAWGEVLELVRSGDEFRAKYGPATLRLCFQESGPLGSVYTVHHWLDSLNPGGVFPIDLSLLRLIIPPTAESETSYLLMAVSDVSYEFCLRYPAYAEVPDSWLPVSGEYDGCTVVVEDHTMRMTGVGYLVERNPNVFEVLGGPYAGETVVYDPAADSLSHQGLEYRRP
jgi:CubicO group peptidase (beta-lactamase class C family)